MSTVNASSNTAAANAFAFSEPHWRVIAAGFETERWFNDGQAVGSGGILNPGRTRLPSGQHYYRFASSASTRVAQVGGGWWLDVDNFALVRRFAAENGYTLREAARLTLALPYVWTRVDLLVRAQLRVRVDAYTGVGKPADGASTGADRGTRWIPTQHMPVRQLYVPGLYIPGPRAQERSALYLSVFVQPVEVTALD